MSGRNPDWTRDETILLLDLYLRRPRFDRRDRDVQHLSTVLNQSPDAPRDRLATYRNAAGVAMKLRGLAKQDPAFLATGRRGLKGGGQVDAVVWRDLAHDRARLAREVARIAATWRCQAVVEAAAPTHPSRGPPPLLGVVSQDRADGETEVYLMVLEGPVHAILPHLQLKRGWAVIKVGRSNGVERRCRELNCGLPAAAILRWRPVETRQCADAGTADQAERALLNWAADQHWSLGGEFVLAPVARMRRALQGDQMEQMRQPSRR